MGKKNNRNCIICGQNYSYCPTCGKDAGKPTWYFIFDGQNCHDIYEVCTGWSFEDNMTERGSMSLVDYVIQEIEETILHDDRKMIRFDMDKYC